MEWKYAKKSDLTDVFNVVTGNYIGQFIKEIINGLLWNMCQIMADFIHFQSPSMLWNLCHNARTWFRQLHVIVLIESYFGRRILCVWISISSAHVFTYHFFSVFYFDNIVYSWCWTLISLIKLNMSLIDRRERLTVLFFLGTAHLIWAQTQNEYIL